MGMTEGIRRVLMNGGRTACKGAMKFILAQAFAIEGLCQVRRRALFSLRHSSNPSCPYTGRRLQAVQIDLRRVLQPGLACSAPRWSFHFLWSEFEWENF